MVLIPRTVARYLQILAPEATMPIARLFLRWNQVAATKKHVESALSIRPPSAIAWSALVLSASQVQDDGPTTKSDRYFSCSFDLR